METRLDKREFVGRFGGVFEHSPWVAERAFNAGLDEPLTAQGVQQTMNAVFRAASDAERLAVLRAHPDLAGKLAVAGKLTDDSRKEQAGAGLDTLSAEEHARFTELNAAYMKKFGFPFIIAVKGHDKASILDAFQTRIENSIETEMQTAAEQVERIAGFRIDEIVKEDLA